MIQYVLQVRDQVLQVHRRQPVGQARPHLPRLTRFLTPMPKAKDEGAERRIEARIGTREVVDGFEAVVFVGHGRAAFSLGSHQCPQDSANFSRFFSSSIRFSVISESASLSYIARTSTPPQAMNLR